MILRKFLTIILSVSLVIFGSGCAAIVYNETGLLVGNPHVIHFANQHRISNEERGIETSKILVHHNCQNTNFLSGGPQVLLLPLPIIPWPLGLFSHFSGQSLVELKEKLIEIRVEVFSGPDELRFDPKGLKIILDRTSFTPSKWTQQNVFRYQAGVEYKIWFEATCSDVESGRVLLGKITRNGFPFSAAPFYLSSFESKTKMRDSLPLMHGLYD